VRRWYGSALRKIAPASSPAQSRAGIQLHRHIAPANQMHRFTCRAQRIRQIALRLLTGAENHMIHAQQLRFAADRDV
jgi:hypothetical protein